MKKIMLLLLIGVSSLFSYSGYYAPYKAGTSQKVSQGYDGTLSHHGYYKGAYAVDFAGTFDVYAPKDGIVEKVGKDSYKIDFCVNNPQHWHGSANYLRIKHNDGVYSYYYHLKKIDVTIGTKVIAGVTKLGVSGNTGCSTSTHLHLQFSNHANMKRNSSLKIKFEDIGYPTRGNYYTSQNVGSNLNLYDFWIKQGTVYTNSSFDAQFKLKNNSNEAMEVSAIALSLHDSNHQHKKDFKVDYGVYIRAGQSYSTGFSEITTPSEAGTYYVVAKYQKDNGEWVDLSSQKIIIKENSGSNIDRAEALKLILDKFEISTKNAGFNHSRFGEPITLPSDVTSSTNNYDAIVVGYNRGITSGENGKFYPNRKISLQEFITMIVRTIPIPLDNPNYSSFSYADSNNAFYKYLKAAYNAKILENKSYNFDESINESTANSLLNKAFEYFRGTNSGISIYLKWNTQYVDLDMYAYSPADSSNIEIEQDSNGYITNMRELNSYNNLLYYGKHSTNWGANLDYDSWGGNGGQPWARFGEERATVDSLMVKRPGKYSFIICYYNWGESENPSSASYEMIGYQGAKNITRGGSINGTIKKGMCKVGGTLTTR